MTVGLFFLILSGWVSPLSGSCHWLCICREN